MRGSVLIALILTACQHAPPAPEATTDTGVALPEGLAWLDADGDGFGDPDSPISPDDASAVLNDRDCDDHDARVYPGAEERCNGIDDSCNGSVDEGLPDSDWDGIADCMDSEECDGLDNDGDGLVDEDMPDTDGDGVADCVDSEQCDGLDNDGDGLVDEGFDQDGDGYPPCGPTPDCDDGAPGVSPAAEERDDNGVDDDCDGRVDEGLWQAGELEITELMVNPFIDSDGEGEWFEVLNRSKRTLDLGGLLIRSGGDEHTISGHPQVAPGALALLARTSPIDGGVTPIYVYSDVFMDNTGGELELEVEGTLIDQVSWTEVPAGASLALDPDRQDTASDPTSWCDAREPWATHGDLGSPGTANPPCPTLDHDGDGWSADQGDCDDTDPSLAPGLVDTWYDGIDTDCDGWDDDDADRDGYRSVTMGGADCDDTRPDVHPGTDEVCDDDGLDEDCDGLANDDDPDVVGAPIWYQDADGDGFGADATSVTACDPGPGWADTDGDCDDDAEQTNPDAEEVCGDGLDNDCDDAAPGCGPVGTVSLDDHALMVGDTAGDLASTVEAAGDVDGDGQDDLWVAAPGADDAGSDAGAAYLLRGPITASRSLGDAGTRILGAAAGDELDTIAGGADLDDDGYADVVLGAPLHATDGGDEGAIYVFFGPLSGSLDAATADSVIVGDTADLLLGDALSIVPDWDGDGLPELLVGAPGAATAASNAGAAYLLPSPADSWEDLSDAHLQLIGQTRNDTAGAAVAAVGDTDGDGIGDLVIGAPQESTAAAQAGAAYLFLGPITGELSVENADARLLGDDIQDFAGETVGAAGDVDEDGRADLLVGAWHQGAGEQGAVYVVRGGSVSGDLTLNGGAFATLEGAAARDSAGASLAGPGDINDDGVDDVLVGAPESDEGGTDAGTVHVIYGPVTGGLHELDEVDALLVGGSDGDGAGTHLAGIGDVTGDGIFDLGVGAPGQSDGGLDAGGVYVVPGGPGF